MLSAYQYNIEFKRTKAHGNADGLSRLPLPGVGTDEATVAEVDIFQHCANGSTPCDCGAVRTNYQT